MGKAEQLNSGVPEISPQTEASKLLEAALLQMDGIISGIISSSSRIFIYLGICVLVFFIMSVFK